MLAKKEKDLHSKIFKTANEEAEEDIRRWKALSHSWNSVLSIIKMATQPKATYRFNKTPSKFQNKSSQKLKSNP